MLSAEGCLRGCVVQSAVVCVYWGLRGRMAELGEARGGLEEGSHV